MFGERVVGDPHGREVVLSVERWGHILKGHPELAEYSGAVLKAVESPTEMIPGRELGEEWFYLRGVGPSRWLKVVVRFERGAGGRIITAFPRRRKP